jgi:phospholipid-binding lipoprotein MlaA
MSAAAFAAVMMLTCPPTAVGGPDRATPTIAIAQPFEGGSSVSDQSATPPPVPPAGTPPGEMTPPQTSAPDSDIVVSGRRHSPSDPLAAINQQSYEATQAVDRAVVGPVARTFEHTVPKPARDGLRNFFINLHEPIVFVNYLLQVKPGKAAETAGRFLINSTVGVAGLVDVAKRRPINLPRRKNSFADTLGYYGVKPGPSCSCR